MCTSIEAFNLQYHPHRLEIESSGYTRTQFVVILFKMKFNFFFPDDYFKVSSKMINQERKSDK